MGCAVPPPLRNHHVDSVDDLLAAAKRWKGASGNVVWIGNERLVLAFEGAHIDEAKLHETLGLRAGDERARIHVEGETHELLDAPDVSHRLSVLTPRDCGLVALRRG